MQTHLVFEEPIGSSSYIRVIVPVSSNGYKMPERIDQRKKTVL